MELQGGWATSNAPLQELYLLGGRATIPGYEYRGAVGDRYLLARGWIRHSLLEPWVSLRLTGAAGWSRLEDRQLPTEWGSDTRPGWRSSVGVGVDLLWEVLQFDVARGLSHGGDWSFFFSVSPRLTPWL